MNKYRFVTRLLPEQVEELRVWLTRKDLNERTKIRLRSILRSHDQYTMEEMAELEGVNRDTVSLWITQWETYGIEGLFDCPKQHRRPVLDETPPEVLKPFLAEAPRSSLEVSLLLETQTGKQLGPGSIRRWAKKFGFKWKRARKSLESKRKPAEFEQAPPDLKAFLELETQGKAQVFFFDAAGLELTPCIPYGWYQTGQDHSLSRPASSSKRLNVIGLLSRQAELVPFWFEGTCTAAVVKSGFESFCAQRETAVLTIVVLDNAPVHTAKLFLESIPDWQARGVFPDFLPSYSPELNLIEILWKRMKYSGLPKRAYESFQSLTNSVT